AVRVVGDAEWRAAAHRINAGRAPAAENVAGRTVGGPPLPRTERELGDSGEGQAPRDVAGTDRSFSLTIVEILPEHVERPEAAPVGRRIVHQPAPGEVRQQ